MVKTGSDFSGVGAFDQALDRLNIKQEKLFACDMDKYARQTYIHNYGKPKYYPENVYDRWIPETPLDIYMTSPPCQAFSLAGKRKGESDDRGILFYNSHEFIQKNKPRYFIFENVKGLLSDDNGRTFNNWCEHLGGKSVNGNPVIFPLPEAVPYHIYWKVLNAKDFGVPQNRERVFIIGIRDDKDNNFSFPKPYHLCRRLKDVLESEVDEKYFLSDKMINGLRKCENDFEGRFDPKEPEDVGNCLTARYYKMGRTDNYMKVENSGFAPIDPEGIPKTIRCGGHGSVTNKHNWDVIKIEQESNLQEYRIAALRGRNPENPSDRTTGAPTEQRLEINHNGTPNALTTVQKDNMVVNGYKVRRLTPRECFRLMDFPDTFTWPVSDSQAYKQAGNSIVVNVLAEVIKKLNL